MLSTKIVTFTITYCRRMIMRIILKVFAEIYLGLDFAFLGVNM